MRTFFDSSAFAKRYVEEPGSDAVNRLCVGASDLAVSILCIPEILSALNRRVRERSLARPSYERAKRQLLEDLADAAVINLTPGVLATCAGILEASPLRAMDALHVACAAEWKAGLFASADKRQVAAARKAGLQARLV